MNRVWLWVALAAFATVVHGFEDGAPDTTCDDMKPKHDTEPQTSKIPYSVKLSTNRIRSGGKVSVTISGKNTFKGFFVQGRVGNKAIGQFDESPGAKLVSCHGSVKNGITHANKDEKREVVLNWNAPKGLSESVVFWVTVVKDGGHFWVGHKSQVLVVGQK